MGQNWFLFLCLRNTPVSASAHTHLCTRNNSLQQCLLKNLRHHRIFPPFFILLRDFLHFENDILEKNLQDATWVLINLSMFPKTTQKIAADKDRMLRVAGVTIYNLLHRLHLWNVKKGREKSFRGNGSAVSAKFSFWGKHSWQKKGDTFLCKQNIKGKNRHWDSVFYGKTKNLKY